MHQTGFTLMELLVTLSVLAILATLAFPSFATILQSWQRDSATKAFAADIQQARSQAIKSGRPVIVCSSSDGSSCSDSEEWMNGWIVRIKDGTVVSARATQRGITSMTDEDDGTTEFTFLPNGLMKGSAVTLAVTPKGDSVKANNVSISRVGRVSVAKAS